MSKLSLLSGIQQVGIGVKDAEEAFKWYKKHFGMDVPVFKDASTAKLMTRYTGGKAFSRYAILAMNMQGGGGFEIWQFTDRVPKAAEFSASPGDLGIFGVMMKCRNVEKAHQEMLKRNTPVSQIFTDDNAGKRFVVIDPFGNRFTFINGEEWFGKGKHPHGGSAGVQIGVSNMDRAILFYSELLGFDNIVYDSLGVFPEFSSENQFRRVVLRPKVPFGGAFSRLLGPAEIELVQLIDGLPKKIFANRFWGDLGFIHICFDVNNMFNLEQKCNQLGFPFTVNSADSFDMGEAAGHFSYTEDPDGTLIEFVQTHRIPLIKKIGWYLDLRKRNPSKPLPNWILSTLKLSKEKD
jgi:catechol 2,3-dioxygenase-like lactoylglutathione lyase family enzyme